MEPPKEGVEQPESPFFPGVLTFRQHQLDCNCKLIWGLLKRHRPWFKLKKVLLARASAPQFAECIYKDVFQCKLYRQLPLLNGQEENLPRNIQKEGCLIVYPWLPQLTSPHLLWANASTHKHGAGSQHSSELHRIHMCGEGVCAETGEDAHQSFQRYFQSHLRRNQWCKQLHPEADSQVPQVLQGLNQMRQARKMLFPSQGVCCYEVPSRTGVTGPQ